MVRLLRDRYLEYAADVACDLVTGATVAAAEVPAARPPTQPSLGALAEVLEHGRDGTPRYLEAQVARPHDLARTVESCAREAGARGFVPIGADVYLRVRALLGDELHDRALMLIGRPDVAPAAARAALLDAASRSPRPHVLLILRADGSGGGPHTPPCVVREPQAAYNAAPPRAAVLEPPSREVARHIARAAKAEAFIRAGRHAAAERLLRDVAAALLRRGALAPAAETYIALGRVLLERGRAADAEPIFAEAAAHGEAGRIEAIVATARVWQAAARTDLGQLTSAEAVCRAVLLVRPRGDEVAVAAEAALARTLLWQGRVQDATELAVGALSTEASTPFAAATAVRVLLARGDIFDAGQCARALVAATETSADPIARTIALTAHLRVLIAAGDLELAQGCLAQIQHVSALARSPLRLARARVLWIDALRRAGREVEAAREVRCIDRFRAVAPPLLRAEIERRLKAPAAARSLPRKPSAVVPPLALALVGLAQRDDDDRVAIQALLDTAVRALQGSRLDLWSADAGPDTVILHAGAGLPTRLGARTLESGIAIGPEAGDPAHEMAAPVRLGSRLLAALAVRWPADRRPGLDAADVLVLTAAVAAPRIESLLAAGRASARAATFIPELVGTSAAIAEVRRAVVRAAAAPFAVLVEGESGVGKELVARAIHQVGPRRERRFCDVNCAALPDELLESELFGHARGAFTGAVAERAGLLEEANGGTLFLDEVIDLSPRAQAKLLRVLQQQEVRRVGESFSRKVDVRIVSAANRDLRAEAAAGRFRQDLLYRLDVVRIRIPPLRERPEDLPALAEHFWRAAAARVGTSATLSHGVIAALTRYAWPGNVRELQNVIATLAVEAPSRGQVRMTTLPAVITGATAVTAARLADARAQFEKRFVEMGLARAAGNRTRTARELGLTRQGLLKLMARLGIE